MASFVYAAQSALGMSLAANSAAKTAIEKSDKAISAAEDAKAAAAANAVAATPHRRPSALAPTGG